LANDKLGWILPVPFLIFGVGAWLYFQTESEVAVQITRAQAHWREGAYRKAIKLYEAVYQHHPKSQYADDALWEMANVYYVNLYDADHALLYFRKLTAQYPDGPLAADAHLKLAEIYEVELGDLAQAAEHLDQALLAQNVSLDFRRSTLFKMAGVHVKMDQFEQALRKFQLVIGERPDDHLAQQARNRIGTIYQITNQYEKSLVFFGAVSKYTDCSECRVESHLGLIESYEFLGDLGKALETADSIPVQDFSQERKQELLKRLGDKSKYYLPKRWPDR
jgi:TolA-binding protein